MGLAVMIDSMGIDWKGMRVKVGLAYSRLEQHQTNLLVKK